MERNNVMDIELTPEMFEKLDDSKKNSEKISYESKTYLADAWNRFKANKLMMDKIWQIHLLNHQLNIF